MSLSPQDVRDKQFATVRMRAGYDMDEVDAFLDQIEAEIARLLGDNDELRSRLAAAQSQALRHDTTETNLRTPAPAPAVVPAPAPAPAVADIPAQALAMLEAAQRTADETVATARAEADALLSEARRRAGSVTEDLESERIALEEQVNALRAFERTYRMRLREYIATQLTNFDSLASTPSVVADLPDAPALQPLHELPSAPPQQAPPATA